MMGVAKRKPTRIEIFHAVIGVSVPVWVSRAMELGRIKPANSAPALNDWARDGMLVHTPHGDALLKPNDYLIKSSDGHLHVVKPVDFERTYFTPKLQGKRADLVILDELDP
jgi:hypothetical protein